MKNNGIRFITEMGIFIALGLVFDIIAEPLGNAIWPAGGSISIAMVPIFMMSFRHGLKGGLLSGFAIGSIQLLWAKGLGLYHWSQPLLDYTFAYGLVGVAGIFGKLIFKNKDNWYGIAYTIIAILIGGLLRTFAHITAGVLFFSEDLFAQGVSLSAIWIGSTTYNVGYMAPSIILCMIIMIILVIRYYNLVEYLE